MSKYLISSLLCVVLLTGFGLHQACGLFAAEPTAAQPLTADEVAVRAALQQSQGRPPHWRAMLMHGHR